MRTVTPASGAPPVPVTVPVTLPPIGSAKSIPDTVAPAVTATGVPVVGAGQPLLAGQSIPR